MQGAAHGAHVSQPALSRRIRDLEVELGCDLFVRTARGITPTRAGAALYRRAVNVMEDLDQACQGARRIGREQANLARLGLVQTSRKLSFVRNAIAEFDREQQGKTISLSRGVSSDLSARLREGQLDITLLYERRIDARGFRERPIHIERYVLALHPSHRLAVHEPVRLADLVGEPLVWFSRGGKSEGKDLLIQQCRLHGLEPTIAHVAESFEGQIDLVTATSGACLTPALTMASVSPGALVFRPLPGFETGMALSLAWSEELSPSATALLGYLHTALDRHQSMITSGDAEWARLMGHEVVRVPASSEREPEWNWTAPASPG